ncbi:alpha/beta fold hydrolase [Companilactobacillus mishanensis]|uniref:Alpha/beta hydrolase n=1 Tax=Companilactobacillus mishanensis TaxID=2486008 RepID=A0ABW9P7C0_9LACO|nr:alpha/beta hydrolase [Companilactobacillus mishanensis]MQS45061.1 alpha/beta hydrolase [Companilactobacillus mishanensis]
MEQKLFTSNGEVNVKVTGDLASDKEIIVLVHGIDASLEYFDEITPFLEKRFTVVAVDLLGHGKSDPAKDENYQMDSEAWAVWEAIAKLRIVKDVTLFGYGIGGLIVTQMTEMHDISVKDVVMLNTPANEKYAYINTMTTRLGGMMASSQVKAKLYFAKGFDTSTLSNPKVVQEASKQVERKTSKQLQKIAPAYLEEKSMNKRLRALPKPALLLYGTEDQILGEDGIKDAKASLERVPDVKIRDIEGAGHAAMLEQPEKIANEIFSFNDIVTKAKEN